MIEMLIAAIVAPMIVLGFVVLRTLFRWACVHYRRY